MDLLIRCLLLSGLVYFLYASLWLKKSLSKRIIRGLVPLAAIVAVLEISRHILSAPFWDRNAARLVGAFCLRYGLPLYSALGQGAIESMNYPPLAAIAFLPAVLGHTPTAALLIGEVLTVLYFFVPVGLILYGSGKRLSGETVAAGLVFIFMTLHSSPLSYSALRLHVDAPALGLAALACYFLQGNHSQDRIASAACLTLSLWTKQTMAPFLVILPLWIAATEGFRPASTYLGWVLGLMAAMAGVVFLWIRPADLFLNLFYLSRTPYAGPLETLIASQSRQWLFQGCVFLGVLACCIRPLLKEGLPLTARRWPLYAVIGLAMAPVAVWTRAKEGVDMNAFSLSLYFLAIAAALALLEAVEREQPDRPSLGSAALVSGLVLLTIVHGPLFMRYGLADLVRILPKNPQQTAYEYAKIHPDEIYFPWNPLSSLMAEKKLYHFEPALKDWAMARYPVSPSQYAAFVPVHLRWVAFHKSNEFLHATTRRYLPQFSQRVALPELPDWTVYERSNTR